MLSMPAAVAMLSRDRYAAAGGPADQSKDPSIQAMLLPARRTNSMCLLASTRCHPYPSRRKQSAGRGKSGVRVYRQHQQTASQRVFSQHAPSLTQTRQEGVGIRFAPSGTQKRKTDTLYCRSHRSNAAIGLDLGPSLHRTNIWDSLSPI